MSHVKWPLLLPLSLRLNAVQAVLELGQPFEVLTQDKGAQAIWDELDTVGRGQMADAGRENRSDEDAEKEGPALDAYFQRVSLELTRRMSQQAAASAEANGLLTSLRNSLERPLCPACCSKSADAETPKACRWTYTSQAEDHQALIQRGRCLQSVRDVFEFAKTTTLDAYEGACNSWTPATLSFQTAPGSHNSVLELSVEACVKEDDDSPLQVRHVHLSFDAKNVEVCDYLALAYVLMHECVAHGYCGINIEEPRSSLSIPFHEGWMDCVAAYVAEDALIEHEGRFGQLAAAFTNQMNTTRALRLRRGHGHPKEAREWLAGTTAFRTFEALIQLAMLRPGLPTVGTNVLARNALVRLSLALNASDLPHKVRSDFVWSINRHYSSYGKDFGLQAVEKMPQVIDFIEKYLESDDWEPLVLGVASLQDSAFN